ncbi:MAG: DUF5915 domain-containing protein, partial [Chloroflexota bacterium]
PYARVRHGEHVFYLAEALLSVLRGEYDVLDTRPGAELVGRPYRGPFDELPAQRDVAHRVIVWEEVSDREGTGIVHIAPGCGKEDFALGGIEHLPVLAPIDEAGNYFDGYGFLTGQNAKEVTKAILASLREKGVLYRTEEYRHRYPHCWRCGSELVFRVVDEWFISMEELRPQMIAVVNQIQWIPEFCRDRELDWLRNMGDWMISKKRYWGLALPFWVCPDGHLTVIGGKEELFERALGGLDRLESPHRPWVDEITVACSDCGQTAHRIPDVGNPWLDAGIVPYSTLHYDTDRPYWEEWFPAEFITESFPGQFRNWFYSMLAMSTVLQDTAPFLSSLGYALVRDEEGREMHKSWGNLIPFDEAADRSGADIMRWLFCLHDPFVNLGFGFEVLDAVKRRLLVLWNTYSFFVTYANVDGWSPSAETIPPRDRSVLDRWILARLHTVIRDVRAGLDVYDAMNPARSIESFIEELSTWYVRRSRRRFWRTENDADKLAAYSTLYECLTRLSRLIAPFMPFLAESLYQNLVRPVTPHAPMSVHLTDYPEAEPSLIDEQLLQAMDVAQRVVALGRAARERANFKVRQPLSAMYVAVPKDQAGSVLEMRDIILEELNVKGLELAAGEDQLLTYSIRPNLRVLGPRFGKLVPKIRAALDELPALDVVHAVEQGQPVSLRLESDVIQLQPDEILSEARERTGFAAMSGGGLVVALDTILTPELIREGWAREVIRRLNDWRRDAGFQIDDRIALRYQASPQLAEAISVQAEYIQRETLSVELVQGPLEGAGFYQRAEFDGRWLEVELRHA